MIKILVVEDDRAINGLVCKYLEDNGYQAVSAYDGEEGLKAFESQSFDMIISDIMMPKIDGFALIRRVRESNKKIPVLFMTALDDKPSKQYGYTIGIDDYVVKPFDAEILMLRVGALIRRANIETSRELVAGNLRMNADEHTAYLNGGELPLTVREFDLLYKLLSYP
ncbi:MAG: response regulator transcription factor, partial [Clostridia bacterium]|nr:response regulator transcription factor [Clostridia bacterium]